MPQTQVERRSLHFVTRCGAVSLSLWQRPATSDTVFLYLHGLGSTKEDFSDAVRHPAFDQLTVAAFDFPGCGESSYPADGDLGLDDLVDIIHHVLTSLGRPHVIVCGHSLGGLAALLFAKRESMAGRVIGFVNVEGNLAPEDCFFSRQVSSATSYESAEAFFEAFRAHLFQCDRFGYEFYAAGLAAKIQPRTAIAYFKSIISHTDRSPLLDWFVALGIPKQFVYGEQNDALSYLSRLEQSGVELAQIPRSSHFPAITNAVAFFDAVGGFVNRLR